MKSLQNYDNSYENIGFSETTPRKGASMLASSGQPHKGLPMYNRTAAGQAECPDGEQTIDPSPGGDDTAPVAPRGDRPEPPDSLDSEQSVGTPEVSWNETSPVGSSSLSNFTSISHI